MVARTVVLLCAQALLIQSISAQCYGAAYPALAAAPLGVGAPCGVGYAEGLGYAAAPWGPFPAAALAASNGPGLAVTSVSPISPVGVTVTSENAIEGALAVAGSLPFLGTVALEGALPTAGAGAISYGCGNGEVAILAEDIAAAPLGFGAGPLDYAAGPLGYGVGPLGYAAGPLGYGALAGPYGTCGCGARI